MAANLNEGGPSVRKIDCGCEFNRKTLISLCESHADFYQERLNRPTSAPKATPRPADRPLRDALLVALAPTIVGRAKRGDGFGAIADCLMGTVEAIMERIP
jgi:hypothetical protein